MEQKEPRLSGRYPKIPDHSDLRGFSYRAPSNYQWSDDHPRPEFYQPENGNFHFQALHDPEKIAWKGARNFTGIGPKGYKRPDERVWEEVCESLMNHSGIDASDIEVTVESNIVSLRGSVPNRWMKRASEWAVTQVTGVREIRNELNVS